MKQLNLTLLLLITIIMVMMAFASCKPYKLSLVSGCTMTTYKLKRNGEIRKLPKPSVKNICDENGVVVESKILDP